MIEPPHLEPCPHCNSDAALRPSSSYRYQCNLCGKPRIPTDTRLARTTKQTTALLKQAHRSRLVRIGWLVAGLGLAGSAVFFGIFTLLALTFDWSALVASVFGLFTLASVLLTVLSWSTSKKAGQKSKEALDEAWQTAANRMWSATNGQLNPQLLAETMGIDAEYATRLLAETEVQQLLASDYPALDPVKVRVAAEGDLDAESWDEAEKALGNLPTQAMPERKQ